MTAMNEDESIKGVIPAPKWLIDQMEALKKLPPPSLEKVEIQFAASDNYSRQNQYLNTDYIR